MANSGGIITGPIRLWSDVRSVLGVATGSQGELCLSSKINLSSKVKPQSVNLGTGAEPTFYSNGSYAEQLVARNEAIKKGCYGLTNIPCFTRAINMRDWMRGKTASTYPTNMPGMGKGEAWTWRKPTRFRKIDFDGYYHNAQPMVTGITPKNVSVPLAGTCYIDVNLNSNSREIRVQDLCQLGVWLPYGSLQHSSASAPYNLYLGLCIVKNSETSPLAGMVFSDQYASDESSIVSFCFTGSQFGKIFKSGGTFSTFVFLGAMDVMPDGLVEINSQQGTFYPINCSETRIAYTNQAADLSISVSGGMSATGRGVTARFEINNRSSTGIYIVPRVELLSGDAYAVVDTAYLGSRQYLAAKGNFVRNDISLNQNGSTDLSIRAVIEVYESDTAFEPIETISTTPKAVTSGLDPTV